MPSATTRPAWADVDLDAIAANVRLLADTAAPALLCAVVKAEGYGHGAVPVARIALEAGAACLAVAIPAEGRQLREAGIDAPILVLAEFHEWHDVVAHDLTPTVYSEQGIARLVDEVRRQGKAPIGVHLKVDTGMHRIGVSPEDALARAKAIVSHAELRLDSVWTHCPVADEPGNPFTTRQAECFAAVVAELREAGIEPPFVHAANSAATLAHPELRLDLVRCGIAVYGLDPSPALSGAVSLRPALTLKARVTHVQVVPAGDAVSYGLRRAMARDTVVATVPIGYADGVPRRLSDGGEVLIGGRRRPLAGTITMDQLMVDCADDEVAVGDEVVLLGRQGAEEIPVSEWAERLDTIVYEITCGLSPRVPRVYLGAGGVERAVYF
jgi:alanine racemase